MKKENEDSQRGHLGPSLAVAQLNFKPAPMVLIAQISARMKLLQIPICQAASADEACHSYTSINTQLLSLKECVLELQTHGLLWFGCIFRETKRKVKDLYIT